MRTIPSGPGTEGPGTGANSTPTMVTVGQKGGKQIVPAKAAAVAKGAEVSRASPARLVVIAIEKIPSCALPTSATSTPKVVGPVKGSVGSRKRCPKPLPSSPSKTTIFKLTKGLSIFTGMARSIAIYGGCRLWGGFVKSKLKIRHCVVPQSPGGIGIGNVSALTRCIGNRHIRARDIAAAHRDIIVIRG